MDQRISEEKIQVVNEVHRPARRNYPRRQVHMRGIDETWQADLVDMTAYEDENDGYRYILTVIDIFSKFAWAAPIKRKTGVDVAKVFRATMMDGKRVPQKLHVDKGTEFYNKSFRAILKRYKIQMYSTHSNLKASICERFNRTLKERMWKLFSVYGSYRWIDILPDILSSYNDTKHRTIKMIPKDVTPEKEKHLRLSVYGNFIINEPKISKFKLGDKVRISKFKHVFEKGYTPNWTMEIFNIKQILNTNPITYLLCDYQNKPIDGCFYEYELIKAKYSDVYLIDKIVQRKGKKVLVKWLEFSDAHNTWEDETNFC